MRAAGADKEKVKKDGDTDKERTREGKREKDLQEGDEDTCCPSY